VIVLSAVSRRRTVLIAALCAVAALLLTSSVRVAFAAPGDDYTDDEGGTKSLREQLDVAATAWQDAKAVLDKSEERQLEFDLRLATLEAEREALVNEVQAVAGTAYRTGRVGALTALLSSGSAEVFMERAATMDMLTQYEDKTLTRLAELRESVAQQRALIEAEVELQQKEVRKLDAARKKAEEALFAVGGGATGQFVAYDSPDAKSAPRNEDGSWPAEGCTEPDPTTSGCLKPRMLHALNEARLFGFTRHTSCYRTGTFGEHPLGGACDFSAEINGFGGVATGGDKEYGDRLASFFIHNADRFGVMYVIWYRQSWFPGSGWGPYGGAGGDPSSNHDNHVHISIR
jgi:hypothetical protein